MVDNCNRTEIYPNGIEVSIEQAIREGDFQIESACKGCTLECKKRIDNESKYGMKY